MTYSQNTADNWTRIDMLIALYDAAIRHTGKLIEAHQSADPEKCALHRAKAMRLTIEISSGLDHSFGELPHQIARLCEFVRHELLTGGIEGARSALRVLETLADGFEAIRGSAAKLEYDGEIDPINNEPLVQVTL